MLKTYSRQSIINDRLRFCFANRKATIEGATMKKILLCVVALLPLAAHAGKITMSNPDEQELQGGKRLCTYENSIYLFTLVTHSQSCPYSKTFDSLDNEK